MQKSLLAGISIPNLSALKKPAVPPPSQDRVPPAPVAPAASQPEPAAPVPAVQAAVRPEPAAPAAVRPEPATPAPVATQPEPKPEPAAPAAFQPEPADLGNSAAPLYEGKPRRKAGRPRINPDRPLNGREKSVRYRQRHKALLAEALSGTVNPAEMSHKDLCLAVARVLNHRDDLILRQTGYPMVKELQRRLKNL